MTQSFRTRLLLSFLAVILLALLLPAWYSRHIFGREALNESKEEASRQLALLVRLAGERPDLRDGGRLQAWLDEAAARLKARLTFLAPDGSVLADAVPLGGNPEAPAGPFERDVDPAISPEVAQAARAGGASVPREGQGIVSVASALPGGPGEEGPRGVLRLAAPYADADVRFAPLAGDFLLIIGLTLAAAVAVSLFLARQLATSIGAMISVAEAIGKGNYRQRLRAYPGKEFDALARSINNMAESIETHIQTITNQKGQLEAILNGMREGVMVLDARGVISTANPALAAIMPGRREGGFDGRTPLEAVMSPELQEACGRVLSGPDAPGLVSLQIELGPSKIYDVSIVRLKGENGLGAVVVFHDISELKRLEQVRRDFVANVSHELRTPLTSIKGYAETLLGEAGDDPGALASFLEIILKNANHMAKMVNDLLNLARLEADRQPFKMARVNAASALASAYRECTPLARAKDIRLDSQLPEEGVFVQADQDRLVQVFRNLLENAIKYSPPGQAVSVLYKDGGAMATFGVRDAGPGIPPSEQTRIFERFYRVEKHRTKHSGSSGLGLAIAKHIVERHGGAIWVESSPERGGGAAFLFTLPNAPRAPQEADDERPAD